MKKIVFVSGLVLIAACVYFCKSCGGNGLNGKEFDCYDEGLRTLITFESDSTVVCHYCPEYLCNYAKPSKSDSCRMSLFPVSVMSILQNSSVNGICSKSTRPMAWEKM